MNLHLHTAAYRNGTLHLAYGAWNYPYLYPRTTGSNRPVGFLVEIWRAFTDKLAFTSYPYEHSDTVCDGILVPVQEGVVIATAGAYTPTPLRAELFRSSSTTYFTAASSHSFCTVFDPPISHNEFDFYEANRSSEEDSTELVFFTVFSLPALALLIASNALGTFLQFLISSLRTKNVDLGIKRNPFAEVSLACSQFCLLWGLTLAVYYHAAGFRGNAVMNLQGSQTTFSDLVSGLHDGSRQLITTSSSTFSNTELYALVGNRTNQTDFVQPDQQKMLQQLCDDKSLVTMIEVNAVHAMSLVQRPCTINKITVPQPWPGLDRFDTNVVQNYQISRKFTSSGSVEAVNQVLLRIFPQDLIEGFWTRRFLSTLKDIPAVDPGPAQPTDGFQPMSLSHLQLLFYFTGPGWILSILIFLLEINPLHSLVASIMRFVHAPRILTNHKISV